MNWEVQRVGSNIIVFKHETQNIYGVVKYGTLTFYAENGRIVLKIRGRNRKRTEKPRRIIEWFFRDPKSFAGAFLPENSDNAIEIEVYETIYIHPAEHTYRSYQQLLDGMYAEVARRAEEVTREKTRWEIPFSYTPYGPEGLWD